MKKSFLFTVLLVTISLSLASYFFIKDVANLGTSDNSFQVSADVLRLEHLQYYGGLIEEFYALNGAYPLEDIETDLPIYAFVANNYQEEYTGDLPFEYYHISTDELVEELESGLGREIKEYYDPQFAPMYKPNFYMYLFVDDTYFFAVHLSQEYSFTQHVADYYYKVEISNQVDNNYAFLYDELINNTEFIDASSQTIENEGFYRDREEDYLYYTKNL